MAMEAAGTTLRVHERGEDPESDDSIAGTVEDALRALADGDRAECMRLTETALDQQF